MPPTSGRKILMLDLFEVAMDRDVDRPQPMPEGIVLNVGAGEKIIEGAVSIDYPEWDADRDNLRYGDETISGIHAYHFLEHVVDPVKVLLEFQRVLKPGGILNICVPYYTSQMAAHDLDHKHQFCEETWRVLFSNPYYDKNRIEWKLEVRTNMIIGIVERNLALITQMEKL
jgi:SAM-dependent methyltransferase